MVVLLLRIVSLQRNEVESPSMKEAEGQISMLKERLTGLVSSQTSLQKALDDQRKLSATYTATIESLESKMSDNALSIESN